MTTQQIRKNILVYEFKNDAIDAEIRYLYNGTLKAFMASAEALYTELLAIGSVENKKQYSGYELSQWDALNLVIRHELAIEIEKEDGMMNIDKAIEKLKKP